MRYYIILIVGDLLNPVFMDKNIFKGDENKSESYLRRRDLLLGLMKRERWCDIDDRPRRPLKIKPPTNFVDISKRRNQFL